jgi:hypothetical protein
MRRLTGFLASLLLIPAIAFAQNDRATITGSVTDPSGAVIVGAKIAATNTATGVVTKGATNSSGLYTLPGLPIGTYSLSVSRSGFNDYVQTDIILIATQVLQLNVKLTVGSSAQTVTVTGGAPLLDASTASVSTTLEQSAIEDLPLNANNGQDVMNMLLAVTPGARGGQGTNQDFVSFAGQQNLTNSVYLNGVESTAGLQGNSATPSRDSLQEVQAINNVADAEFGTGSAEIFQIKSGTNKFHGSAFEIMQNEDLNANTWSNKYYLSSCAGVASCLSKYGRGRDRFNDYGGSVGGPIRKDKTFFFGDFERYRSTNLTTTPNSVTVPTPKMLTGDFSDLLTGGTNTGVIPGSMNPCTGQPYQYGQIFDPTTQKVINGVTCATPFSGNVIPTGRISSVAQKVAAIYGQYYSPTLSTRPYSNFPHLAAPSAAFYHKTSMEFRIDQYFSDRHHLSGTFQRANWSNPAGCSFLLNDGPLSSCFISVLPSNVFQLTDDRTITPNLLNEASGEFTEQINIQSPGVTVDPSSYGFNVASKYFPVLSFGSSNGVGVTADPYDTVDDYYGYWAYHYQDTVHWTKGKHSMKFGATFMARGLNETFGGNVQSYSFPADTGGPVDPSLTPWVGSGFATMMLGDVYSASEQVNQAGYPRMKNLAFFAQDDFRATPKLTVNLGLRWDFNFRGHEQAGRWQNFDLTQNNPSGVWGNYLGAWQFVQNSGQSFFTQEAYRQFAPRIGAAYQLDAKTVVRASYGLYWIPISIFNSGYGPSASPANQNGLSFPTSTVNNTVPGSVAFNWDNGYPAVPITGPQNSTNTIKSSNNPEYIYPGMLHLGFTQNWYAGIQRELTKNTALDLEYIANRGRNPEISGMSQMQNYPSFSTYDPVLLAGNISKTVSNASQAAAIGVPYPFAGFSGPAYDAIAPYPQLSQYGQEALTYGDPDYTAISAYNSFVVEFKARSAHGLYADFNYVLSKTTGNISTSNGNWAGGTSFYGQNYQDWLDSRHWLQSNDQRNVLNGYLTYQLPIGRSRMWFSNVSTPVNMFIGGWEIGYDGEYASGTPIGAIGSSYTLPFYYGGDRAFLSSGASLHSPQNLYHKGKLDLANVKDPINNDFNTKLFVATTAQNPFGNTPAEWNHWRWDSTPAQESVSLTKHFLFGADGRYQGILSAQFFNVFNRHYYGGPGTGMTSTSYGQISSVSGNRVGQLTGRFTF